MAQTRTRTLTFARLKILSLQVSVALRRGAEIEASSLKKVLKGVEKKWIGKIIVYGVSGGGERKAQMQISIDWERHEVHVSEGRDQISTDKWGGDTAIELDEALILFESFLKENDLTAHWCVQYVSAVSAEMIDRELGFRSVALPNWARGTNATIDLSPKEIDEMTVGLRLLNV